MATEVLHHDATFGGEPAFLAGEALTINATVAATLGNGTAVVTVVYQTLDVP